MTDLERMKECSHSFNSENECEYCGISEQEYNDSCMDGEPVGKYE